MDIGLFLVPFRDPATGLHEGFEWDMQVIRWADEFGLSEVWVAEHSTMRWEPVCSPELYIAAALQQTRQIKFGTGANVPGNHNPMALAHRLMQLDHMSNGRLMVGLGAGAYPTDHLIHGNTNPGEKMAEAVEIMRTIWEKKGPLRYEGKYWQFEIPAYDEIQQGPFMEPLQKPHPPLLMAGLSPASRTMTTAGRLGYLPMSFNVGREYLAGHWYRYMQGADAAGFAADRNEWRVAHNILVADTDEEAMDLAVNGAMGKTYREWMLPGYARGGMLPLMVPELGVTDPDDVPIEYLAEEKWLVGSPDTVIKKLQRDLDASGGFGKIISFTFDYLDQPERYRRHFELLGTEVIPRIKDLVHSTEPLAQLERPDGVED
ncbi:LLM class flavin-dependent oxidoreductase [Streptomyces sp. NPDC091215]|uniref:LLM class flavin-dependent oxidoreductase n=1 Tax=Streptomyces sp. NPDC091215 TaxID=3155192 RepID=UPI00341DC310